MKIKLFLIVLASLLAVPQVFAQQVVITPKKTVYTRKPKRDFMERRQFTITYPVVSGRLSAPVRKQLEETLSYWRVFETTLKETYLEYWLTEAYFKVNYNRRGVLDIALTREGVAAYPSAQTINLVVDLGTGREVKFDDAFLAAKKAEFAPLVEAKLKAEVREIVRDLKSGKNGEATPEEIASLTEQLEGLTFTDENFGEFSVSDKGVTILYDAGFPHVIEALEPVGRYTFTWAEVAKFVRRDGILASFVR